MAEETVMLALLRFLPRPLRREILLRNIRFDPDRLRQVQLRVAASAEDYFGAARLVHDARVARRFVHPHPSGIAVDKFSVLPSTWTFVAKQGARVVGTMSLLLDSPFKLLIDDCFGAELDALRARGLRLGEFSALACEPAFLGSGLSWCLYRIAFDAARRLGIDRVAGRVKPEAAHIYRDLLQIDLFPALRRDPQVRGGPMAGFAIVVPECEQRLRAVFARLGDSPANLHRFFFAEPRFDIALPDSLDPLPARREAAARLVRARPDVFQSLSPEERRHLRDALPDVAPD